jgi:radical SAM superfamily enzyme YgiQ (UPF0313 family)
MSIPCILPYLKDNGFEVSPVDLNLISSEYYSSKGFLDKCLEKIKKSYSDVKLVKKYEIIYDFLLSQRDYVESIIHNPELFVDYEKYIFAGLYQDELTRFRSIAYHEKGNGEAKNLSLTNYKTVSDIITIINSSDINYYSQFYEDILDNYIDGNVDIVLISLAGISQLIPAFTLCKCIKERYPHIKIILGGNPFTKVINKINDSWEIMFQQLFDYILLYEGEYVVTDLFNCIKTHGNIFDVPSCIHYSNGKIIVNKIDTRTVDVENGFTPDFRSYNLKQYCSPFTILPYFIERGCYWKKCTFCDHDFGYNDCYRIKTISKIIADIKEYINLYDAKYVHFVDEAIPPAFIEKMCNAFIENNIQIKWFTCIKASKKFNKELCELMKKAGCVFVSIGIESCCQSVLDKMNKGIVIEDIETTLKYMHKAKIWTHSFMINDFEGETYKDKWETFGYINKHKDLFVSIGIGNFTLSKNAKIFNRIELSEEDVPISDFTNDYSYKSKTSLDEVEYEALSNTYNNLNFTSKFFSRFIFEREHLAIFIGENENFINSRYLESCVEPIIAYNKKYLITYVEDKLMYVYNMMNKKYFVLPKEFMIPLERFDGDIEKLKRDEGMDVFINKDQVIDFILNQLYD